MLALGRPVWVSSTLVLQSLPDAFDTLLLIEAGHGGHQVNQHVVNHTHDGGINTITFNRFVRRGQVSHYQTQAFVIDDALQRLPLFLTQTG
ncbi:hypothetical protein D9M70_648180 [compost metagenome]